MLLDTCFLIDLQKELRAQKIGNASILLNEHLQEKFYISVITVTEFLEGFEDSKNGEALLRSFNWVAINDDIARKASRIRRSLQIAGHMIGDFDILIAATAQVMDQTLVTNNQSHFKRVSGLKVLNYK